MEGYLGAFFCDGWRVLVWFLLRHLKHAYTVGVPTAMNDDVSGIVG